MKDFIFLGSKIIVDGYCCHEIKRRLLFGRKDVTNLKAWNGKEDGRELQKGGDIYLPMADSFSFLRCAKLRFDRRQQNSVRKLSFNKK